VEELPELDPIPSLLIACTRPAGEAAQHGDLARARLLLEKAANIAAHAGGRGGGW
jgi:hypothetical protein